MSSNSVECSFLNSLLELKLFVELQEWMQTFFEQICRYWNVSLIKICLRHLQVKRMLLIFAVHDFFSFFFFFLSVCGANTCVRRPTIAATFPVCLTPILGFSQSDFVLVFQCVCHRTTSDRRRRRHLSGWWLWGGGCVCQRGDCWTGRSGQETPAASHVLLLPEWTRLHRRRSNWRWVAKVCLFL